MHIVKNKNGRKGMMIHLFFAILSLSSCSKQMDYGMRTGNHSVTRKGQNRKQHTRTTHTPAQQQQPQTVLIENQLITDFKTLLDYLNQEFTSEMNTAQWTFKECYPQIDQTVSRALTCAFAISMSNMIWFFMTSDCMSSETKKSCYEEGGDRALKSFGLCALGSVGYCLKRWCYHQNQRQPNNLQTLLEAVRHHNANDDLPKRRRALMKLFEKSAEKIKSIPIETIKRHYEILDIGNNNNAFKERVKEPFVRYCKNLDELAKIRKYTSHPYTGECSKRLLAAGASIKNEIHMRFEIAPQE